MNNEQQDVKLIQRQHIEEPSQSLEVNVNMNTSDRTLVNDNVTNGKEIPTQNLSKDPSRAFSPGTTTTQTNNLTAPVSSQISDQTRQVNTMAKGLPTMEDIDDYDPMGMNESPEAPSELFTPEEPEKSEDEVNWEGILEDGYRRQEAEGYVNTDKMGTPVPMSTIEEMNDTLVSKISASPETASADMRDMISDINIVERARTSINMATGILVKALERIEGDLSTIMSNSIVHEHEGKRLRIADSAANITAVHKDKTSVNLNLDKNPEVTVSALLGGNVRKYYLFNSGITINLRRISLKEINKYVREITEKDAEYGRQFGGFYYMYSDLYITKFIIENLLPVAICGSSFTEWRSTSKLMKAISFQDYHTILWALALTMHPKGIEVNYACGNPECGKVTTDTVDLFKLRLQNNSLINKEMKDFFVSKHEVTLKDLEEYRDVCGMKRTISLTLSNDRQVDIDLRQATLSDYVQVGTEFYTELETSCNVHADEEVERYLTYNIYKAYRPWIDKCTIYDESGRPYIIDNDSQASSINVINQILDELQRCSPEFGDKVSEYILDTKISHIAFFMNTCPKCGTKPTYGKDGFIPYDPQYNFFIHALSVLHRVK